MRNTSASTRHDGYRTSQDRVRYKLGGFTAVGRLDLERDCGLRQVLLLVALRIYRPGERDMNPDPIEQKFGLQRLCEAYDASQGESHRTAEYVPRIANLPGVYEE